MDNNNKKLAIIAAIAIIACLIFLGWANNREEHAKYQTGCDARITGSATICR